MLQRLPSSLIARDNTKVLMELQEAEDSTILVSTTCAGSCYMHEVAGMHLISTCTGSRKMLCISFW